jgi:hypothetical protein
MKNLKKNLPVTTFVAAAVLAVALMPVSVPVGASLFFIVSLGGMAVADYSGALRPRPAPLARVRVAAGRTERLPLAG